MTRTSVKWLLILCVLTGAGFGLRHPAEKMVKNYVDERIEEHMAGILLNAPPPEEKMSPIIDGFDTSHPPDP